MLNGYYYDMTSMIEQMEPFFEENSGWKRIYIDHPGVGNTKNIEDIQNHDDMLNTILLFVDKIIPNENFVIVGESFGAYLARGILNKKLQYVDGLLLIVPVIEPEREKRDIYEISSKIEFFDKEIEENLFSQIEREYEKCTILTDKAFLEKIRENRAGFSFNVDDIEKQFEKPVLILTGRQDNVVGYKDVLKILDNYPRATFAVLDKANHTLPIIQSNLFKTLVNEWLYRVDEFIKLHK